MVMLTGYFADMYGVHFFSPESYMKLVLMVSSIESEVTLGKSSNEA